MNLFYRQCANKQFCSYRCILFLFVGTGTGAISWRDGGDDGSSSSSAKSCGQDGVGSELMRTDHDSLARQSTNGTFISGPHPNGRKSPSHPSQTSLNAGGEPIITKNKY